jgi:molecular chaperone IbpA
MDMRTFDYAPLYRSTVGFDRLFNMLDSGPRSDWPPYNIEKIGEHDYRITMALAGFNEQDIEVTQHGPELIVAGRKNADDEDRQILHRGLAIGDFKQVFRIADHVKVRAATLSDGLLSIDLVQEIPEELKPRRIEIGTGSQAAEGSNDKVQIAQDGRAGRKAA